MPMTLCSMGFRKSKLWKNEQAKDDIGVCIWLRLVLILCLDINKKEKKEDIEVALTFWELLFEWQWLCVCCIGSLLVFFFDLSRFLPTFQFKSVICS